MILRFQGGKKGNIWIDPVFAFDQSGTMEGQTNEDEDSSKGMVGIKDILFLVSIGFLFSCLFSVLVLQHLILTYEKSYCLRKKSNY